MVQWWERSPPTDATWVLFWPGVIYGLSVLLVLVLLGGFFSKGFSSRVYLRRFFSEGFSPRVYLRGFFSEGLSPRVFPRGFFSEGFSPRVYLRSFFSEGFSSRIFLRGFFFEDFSPRVLSPGSSGFPLSLKTHISKFQFDHGRIEDAHGVLSKCQKVFIYHKIKTNASLTLTLSASLAVTCPTVAPICAFSLITNECLPVKTGEWSFTSPTSISTAAWSGRWKVE